MIRLSVLIYIISLNILVSQNFELSDWKSYSSHISIRDAVTDKDSNIWCATSGGIFKYNVKQDSFDIYNNINGLSSVNYSAIEYLPDLDIIIAGTRQGEIDLIFNDGRILNIYDIVNSNIVNKSVNSIKYINGIVYLGGGFGISEFFINPDGGVFEQTFGDSYRQVNVNSIKYYGNKIYIATNQSGVQIFEIGNILSDPSNWEKINTENGMPTNIIKDIHLFEDNLYIADSRNVYVQEQDTIKLVKESNYDINMLFEFKGKLYLDQIFGYISLDDSDRFDYFSSDTVSSSTHNGVFIYFNQPILLGEFEGLMFVLEDKTLGKVLPKTSFSNNIYDMEVDNKGNLWVTTGSRGFMMFDNYNWFYFNNFIKTVNGDNIPSNNYKKISIDNNDNIYISHRGRGLLIINKNENNDLNFNFYDQSNSSFVGIDPDTTISFLEAGETVFDKNGVAWTVNWTDNYPGPFLIAKDQNDFYAYENCIGQTKRGFLHMAIDNNGSKWVGAVGPAEIEGIIIYNENGTLDDTSDDICVNLKTNIVPELANNAINSIAVDKNGWVWVGTSTGITYFINPEAVLYDDDPKSLIGVAPDFFEEFRVNHIYVDEINYKWISTTKGIYVYNEDGTQQVAFFNSENSPLPVDEVNNITINSKTGEVFMATDLGLYSAMSISVKAAEEFNIIAYPQPFKPMLHNTLTIEGFEAISDVRITTTNGKLIRKISALGDKIIWDGKDEFGNFVNSGVYLVLASSKTTQNQSVQKIAIINN